VEAKHPACIPVLAKKTDKFYGKHGVTCLNMVRSTLGFDEYCRVKSAEQVSQYIPWLLYASVPLSLNSFD
jgi:hypothetical protein